MAFRFNPTTGKLDLVGESGGDAVDSVNGQTGVVVLDTADIASVLDSRYVTDADLVTLSNTSNTNTGDQLIYGTIAVAGQGDLDPTGTGDTLTLVEGPNITLTTNPATNELTISASTNPNTIIVQDEGVGLSSTVTTLNFTGTGVTASLVGDTVNVDVPSSLAVNEDSFGVVVDGGGTELTTGSKGTKYIPWNCTVTGWDIRSDVSGSCVFDIKRSGTSIAGSEKPTLSSASSNSNLSLSTWTTSLSAGDVIEFVVDSASTLTRATVTILVSKV